MTIDAKTIAAGGLTAGLILGGLGLFLNDDPTPARSDLGALSRDAGEGMLPVADVVTFWQARVDERPDGFLDRTQLGVALASQARQEADLGLYAESEAVLREAVAANPGYLEAQLALGQSLHSQHEFREAREIATDVWLAESTSQAALALLGDTNFELGDVAEAADFYDRLADLDRSAPVVSRLSRLAYVQGRPSEALELADEALALSAKLPLQPDEAAFYWFQLGHTQFAVGAIDDAISSLETALDIAPEHPGATEKLAAVYAAVGRPEAAETLYVSLLEGGAAADLHGSYADLLRDRGALEEAEEQERLGLALALETVDAFPAERRHLAGFFVTRNPALAVELAEADLADRADVGAYDTAARALFYAGRSADAEPLIAHVLSTGIEDASIFAHAGFIAADLGDDDAARRHLTAALAINPSFDAVEAPAARQLLDRLSGR